MPRVDVKVLLVEDDTDTAAFVARGLREHGHAVDVASNGAAGLHLATEGRHDVLIVDRMLPEVDGAALDGLGLVQTLRAAGLKSPVLFLTALGGVGDRVRGLEAGGDDYLVKPFAFAELLARINALARRPPMTDAPTRLQAGELVMDLLKRRVTYAEVAIELQPREFELLEVLLRNADRVVTRTMLLESVWDFHFNPKTNIVETHMSRLRGKLSASGAPDLIHTVRGSGYILRWPP